MYPRLFTLGPVVIPTYGAVLACAVIASVLLAVSLAKRVGLDVERKQDRIWTLALLAVVVALLSARLPQLQHTSMPWLAQRVPILAAILAGLSYVLRVRLPLPRTLDILTPAAALGQGIAGMACLAAGCDYGLPTHARWGVVFTSYFAARTTGVPLGIRLYPTQIFMSITGLLICSVLLGLLARKHSDGEVTGAWLFLSGLTGFFLDFYRGDAGRGSVLDGALTGSQLLAMLMVLLGGVLSSMSSRPPSTRQPHVH